jgi:hypothetical protein
MLPASDVGFFTTRDSFYLEEQGDITDFLAALLQLNTRRELMLLQGDS